MKFLAIFVTLLGFAPTILDHTLSAIRAPAPTRVFPTKTYDPSNVFYVGKAVLQVPPSRVRHNNVGQTGSAISILTALGATSDRTVAGTSDAIIDSVNRLLLQRHWSNLHHLRQIDYGWVITSFLLLLPFLTVGAAIQLERKLHRRSLRSGPVVIVSAPLDPRGTIKCRVPRIQTIDQATFPTRRPIEAGSLIPNATPTLLQKAHGLCSPCSSVEVPKTPGLVDSCKDIVDQPVALKQPYRIIAWITLCSVEGFLSIDPCSPNSDCADAIQWSITFHHRARECPTRSPTHSNVRVTTNERLFNLLYHGISAYHPWTPQLTGVLKIPGEIVNESNKEVGLHARTTPTPATTTQTTPNAGSGTPLTPDPFGDSTKPATPVASTKEDQPRADVVEEDGQATSVNEENEPEIHHRRSKPHRGGRRAAKMKLNQALSEAAEATEAGIKGRSPLNSPPFHSTS